MTIRATGALVPLSGDSKIIVEDTKNITEDKPIDIIQNTDNVEEIQNIQDKYAQKTNLCLENFKELIEKEFGCKFEKIKDVDVLKNRFNLILTNMSDEEKSAKLMFVLENFSSFPELIDIFFNSFKDHKKALECADSIGLNKEEFQKLKSDAKAEIVKHMSAPGANKLFQECKDGAYDFYHKESNKAVIDRVYKNNLSDEERLAIIESLSEEEKAIIKEYNSLTDICLIITQGVTKNKNISQEEKEQFIINSWNFFKELPSGNNRFLDSFAKIFSNDSNELDMDKTKLSELLNKISDNKFSEAVQKQSEKTSVDSETGMLKNKPEEVVAASEEKIESINQEIARNTSEEPTLPQVEHKETSQQTYKSDTEMPLLQALGGIYSFETLKDVITGKTKTQSKSEEHAAIESYKLLNTALQGNLLQRSTGKFFNKLIDNTKTSTLKNLIAIGWKGRSVDITNKVKETIEERKDDVA